MRPEGDPKLAALVGELAAIAKQAAGEALDEEDARQKRKVLVFSQYEDTIDWIEEHISSGSSSAMPASRRTVVGSRP